SAALPGLRIPSIMGGRGRSWNKVQKQNPATGQRNQRGARNVFLLRRAAQARARRLRQPPSIRAVAVSETDPRAKGVAMRRIHTPASTIARQSLCAGPWDEDARVSAAPRGASEIAGMASLSQRRQNI